MTQDSWYYAPGGKQKLGPAPGDRLREMVLSGELAADDLVWRPGMNDWTPVKSVKELQPSKPTPPPLPVPPPMPPAQPAPPPHPAVAAPARPPVKAPKRAFPLLWIALALIFLAAVTGGAFLWRQFVAPPIDQLVDVLPRDLSGVAILRGLPQLAFEFGAAPGGEAAGPFLTTLADLGTEMGLELDSKTSLLNTGFDITAPIGLAPLQQESNESLLIFLPVSDRQKVEKTLAKIAESKGWTIESPTEKPEIFMIRGGGFFYTLARNHLLATTDLSPSALEFLDQWRRNELGSVAENDWFQTMSDLMDGRWHFLVLIDPASGDQDDFGALGQHWSQLAGIGGQFEISSDVIRGRYQEIAKADTEHALLGLRGERRDRFAERIGGSAYGVLRLAVDGKTALSDNMMVQSIGAGMDLDLEQHLVPYLGSPLAMALLENREAESEMPIGVMAWIPLTEGHDFAAQLAKSGLPAREVSGAPWYPFVEPGSGMWWTVLEEHLVVLWQIDPESALASATRPSILKSLKRAEVRKGLESQHDSMLYLNLEESLSQLQALRQEAPTPEEQEVLDALGDFVLWADLDDQKLEAELALYPAKEKGFDAVVASFAKSQEPGASANQPPSASPIQSAFDKQRQKQTISDMRNMGTAYMSWLTDQIGAASAGNSRRYTFRGKVRKLTQEEIEEHLKPSKDFFYMKEIPRIDGWGHPFEVWLNDNLLDSNVILIRSPGRDGIFEEQDNLDFAIGPIPADDYDRDLIWADGYFVRWPEASRR